MSHKLELCALTTILQYENKVIFMVYSFEESLNKLQKNPVVHLTLSCVHFVAFLFDDSGLGKVLKDTSHR